jgi:hypothetical protein
MENRMQRRRFLKHLTIGLGVAGIGGSSAGCYVAER